MTVAVKWCETGMLRFEVNGVPVSPDGANPRKNIVVRREKPFLGGNRAEADFGYLSAGWLSHRERANLTERGPKRQSVY